jgi:hypothetical protein
MHASRLAAATFLLATALGGAVGSAVAAPVPAKGVVEILTGSPGRTILGTLTITGAAGDGWATAYPCADGASTTSNINYRAGNDIANLVAVRADGAGKVCVLTDQRTHVIFDQVGEPDLGFGSAARLLDTRSGGAGTPLAAGATVVVHTGLAGKTVVGNLTVTQSSAPGFLALFPCAQGSSGTSSLNYAAGQTIANAFFARADAAGDLCIRTTALAHVILDTVGSLALDTRNSARVLDSREGTQAVPNQALTVHVGSPGRTIVGNLTITRARGAGWGAIYPCLDGFGGTSNVNFSSGDIADLFVARADANGNLCVLTSTATDVVIDLIAVADFDVHVAVRKLDTRNTSGAAPVLGGCNVFPADNPWNTAIDALPVRAESAAWVNSMGAARMLHPDFAGPYGIPFVVVPTAQPLVPVDFVAYGDESDPGPYPIPLSAPIEDGANPSGDRHVLGLQSGSCQLFELYRAFPGSGRWSADSGAVFDLGSNALRPEGWTSTDAAGLPVLPGLVRYEDIADGVLRHAVRFTAQCTQRGYIHPATHQAGQNNAACPPMGARFRLKASFDTSGFHGQSRIILEGLKTYGLIVADNGSNWYITGSVDARWNVVDIDQLKSVPGDAFEAVDSGPILR